MNVELFLREVYSSTFEVEYLKHALKIYKRLYRFYHFSLSNKSWFDGFLPLSLHNGSSKANHRNSGNANSLKVPATPSTGRHVFRTSLGSNQKPPIASPSLQAPSPVPLSPSRNTPRISTQQQAHSSRLTLSNKKVIGSKESGIPLPISAAIGSGYDAEGRDYSSAISTPPPEETNHVAMVKGRPFNRLKSEIIQVRLFTQINAQ